MPWSNLSSKVFLARKKAPCLFADSSSSSALYGVGVQKEVGKREIQRRNKIYLYMAGNI